MIAKGVAYGSLLALSSLLAACSNKEAPPARTATFEAGPRALVAPPKPAETPAPSASSVQVDDRIRRACGLPEPRFDFDSSKLQGDAARSLDLIAECFLKGPLAGRSMRLVGHADPRGEEEYNLALGQKRASSVQSYIASKGVPAERVSATSRGALDANGTDEQGWSQDRRVDMLLVD